MITRSAIRAAIEASITSLDTRAYNSDGGAWRVGDIELPKRVTSTDHLRFSVDIDPTVPSGPRAEGWERLVTVTFLARFRPGRHDEDLDSAEAAAEHVWRTLFAEPAQCVTAGFRIVADPQFAFHVSPLEKSEGAIGEVHVIVSYSSDR